MDASGAWRLSPAYDLTYSITRLGGNWSTVQGKRSGINSDNFLKLAELMGLSRKEFDPILETVKSAVQE